MHDDLEEELCLWILDLFSGFLNQKLLLHCGGRRVKQVHIHHLIRLLLPIIAGDLSFRCFASNRVILTLYYLAIFFPFVYRFALDLNIAKATVQSNLLIVFFFAIPLTFAVVVKMCINRIILMRLIAWLYF